MLSSPPHPPPLVRKRSGTRWAVPPSKVAAHQPLHCHAERCIVGHAGAPADTRRWLKPRKMKQIMDAAADQTRYRQKNNEAAFFAFHLWASLLGARSFSDASRSSFISLFPFSNRLFPVRLSTFRLPLVPCFLYLPPRSSAVCCCRCAHICFFSRLRSRLQVKWQIWRHSLVAKQLFDQVF